MTKAKLLEKGQKYNKLTIIELNHINNYKDKKGIIRHREYYKCLCDCGIYIITEKSQITTGHTKSCGCLKKVSRVKRNDFHGLSKTKLYYIWGTIKDRCYRTKSIDYKNYGGRGITVYQKWQDNFVNFYNWAINSGYKDGLTIERIDVNGNYEPNNCTWIKNELQSHNRRNNHYLTYNGKTQILSEWAKEMNLHNGSTISGRLKRGWSIEKALTTPIK